MRIKTTLVYKGKTFAHAWVIPDEEVRDILGNIEDCEADDEAAVIVAEATVKWSKTLTDCICELSGRYMRRK